MPRSILVIEDEHDIAELIRLHLGDLADQVSLAFDGPSGLARALSAAWDLIVLDLRLPGMDGLEICRRLRLEKRYVPILMLTSRTAEVDRVLGLDSGADDYLSKPFSVLELIARVRAILRRIDQLDRSKMAARSQPHAVGDITIDVDERRVEVAGRVIELTAREFDLLEFFARDPGKVFTRAQLLDNVWGHGHDGYEHTVNSHINRLRAKVERDPARPEHIITVWGVGYKLVARAPLVAASAGERVGR
jgi:DNA-binding response OmpR family regulator